MNVPMLCRRCLFAVTTGLFVALPVHAAADPPATPDSTEIAVVADLEARALTAHVADQCFLYVQLAQHLTELAGRQLADGRAAEATATLHRLDALTTRIHLALNANPRHLQDAEVLLHTAGRRLADIARVTSDDSDGDLRTTKTHLEAVHAEILATLFRK